MQHTCDERLIGHAFFQGTGLNIHQILDRIKADRRLAGMALVRLPRLSVQPVSEAEWRIVCQMGVKFANAVYTGEMCNMFGMYAPSTGSPWQAVNF